MRFRTDVHQRSVAKIRNVIQLTKIKYSGYRINVIRERLDEDSIK
jgi:hypothetical protein